MAQPTFVFAVAARQTAGAQVYLDVDIAIQPRNGDSYPFTLHAPGGDARGVFVFPDTAEFQELRARLATLETDEQTLTAIGRVLFAAMFQGQARDVLARTQGMLAGGQRLRLRLSIAAEEGKVAALPWELLDDPDSGPLVLSDTPIVRYLPVSARVPTVAATLPLRVLLTGAPTEAVDVSAALEEVRMALGTLGSHAYVTVEPKLTLPVFQRRLREGYHVWHFVGQGGASESGQSGMLLFDDGAGGTKPVSGSQLAVLLGSSGVRLVVLDASAGARLATDPFRTIAPALMKTQVPTVVAMQFGAVAESSQAFAGEFYRALAEGLPIDACVTEGRRAVMGVAGLERPDWATPVVYSRAPDSQLINVPRADIAGRIVTLGSAPGLPPHTSVAVHSAAGTLLHAGPAPTVERLSEKPRPPRPVRSFLNRERELRALAAEIRPRQGAWMRGPLGVGITALLRQAANGEAAQALPDGVVALNSTLDPADASDAVQEIFDRYYRSSTPAKIAPDAARTYLGALRALFILDRLPLPADELATLADTLAESAVLVAADGPAPDTLLDMPMGALPRQEATKLLGAESGSEIDLSNVMFLDRICAALGDLPLPIRLAGRLLRTKAVALKQLVAVAEDLRDEPVALVRAAKLSLNTLNEVEQRALAAVVRAGPAGVTSEALAAISELDPARLDPTLDRLSELCLIEGGGRFAPTTRALGRVLDRLLKPGDEKRRAAAFFAGAAMLHVGKLDWLAAEEANLHQAIEVLLEQGHAAQAGQLVKALQPHVVLRGKWGAWERLIASGERAATAANDTALRAWAAHERGTRAALFGDRAAAQASLSQARQLRQQLGDTDGAAVTQQNMRHAGLLPPPPPASPIRIGARRSRVIDTLAAAAILALVVLLWPALSRSFSSSAATTEPTPLSIAAVTAAATSTQTPTLAPTLTPTAEPTATARPSPTLSPTIAPQCRINAARLNMRAGPGTNYAVLATLTDGAEVIPLGRSADGGWLNVRAGDREGWISTGGNLISCNFEISALNLSETPASPTPTRRPRPTTRPAPRPTAAPRKPTVAPTETPPPSDTPTDEPNRLPPTPTPTEKPLIILPIKPTDTPPSPIP